MTKLKQIQETTTFCLNTKTEAIAGKQKGRRGGVKKNQLMCARFTERTGRQMELQAPKQSESGASPLMFNTRSPSLCAKGGRAAQTRFVAAGLEVFAPHQKKKQSQGERRRRKKNGAQNHHMNKETIGKNRAGSLQESTTPPGHAARKNTRDQSETQTLLLYSCYSTKNGALKVWMK